MTSSQEEVTVLPTPEVDEDFTYDDATWVLTAAIVIFTMQTGKPSVLYLLRLGWRRRFVATYYLGQYNAKHYCPRTYSPLTTAVTHRQRGWYREGEYRTLQVCSGGHQEPTREKTSSLL